MDLIEALISSGSAENYIEAKEIISIMKEEVDNGADPEELLYEYGLEPDYIMDIISI